MGVGELEQHRDDLQLILDALPAFIFYKDTRNRILRVNRAVADSLGVAADDLANTDTARWYPDEAGRYFEDDLEVIASRKPKLGIVEQLGTAGAEKRWISTDKFPQFDGEGNVKGIVVIAHDITERRRMEQELLQAHKLDSIGRLAGGVAHDFNNLLTAILGHLELAQRSVPADSRALEHLDSVRIAAERCAALTKQLLTLARRQVIQARVVDVNDVVKEAGRLLRPAIAENIGLHLTPANAPAAVRIDPGQMLQVLMNMALNARDEMPEGGSIAITVREINLQENHGLAGSDLPPGTYVVLTVRDTGPGISNERRQHLFEPFFTTKEAGRGTGLGLAMCYGAVKQNRGHIGVTSEQGVGTAFDIYLPCAEVAVTGEPAIAASRFLAGVGGGATILVAEDDLDLRALCASVLGAGGYRVLTAANGEDALQVAERDGGAIALLLTDVIMPRMGGVELGRRLRQIRPDVLVLYMSGYIGNSEMPTGDLDLIQKPFRPADLLQRVGEAIQRAVARAPQR